MTLYSLLLSSQRSCGRELRAEGGEGLLHRKGLWGASKTAALLFAAPVGCRGGESSRQTDVCVLPAQEDSGTRLGLGTVGRQMAQPMVPWSHLPAAGPSGPFAGGCRWLAARPPPAGPGAGGRHRLHFKVIVIFDLWDLRGHWPSILEPLTSNLWAIFMASKHCPLIELIEICIWFVGKGHGLTAQRAAGLSVAFCTLLASAPSQHEVCLEMAHAEMHAHTPNTHT